MKQGWEMKRLGEVCNIIGGGTPSKANANFYKGNVLWATVRDMTGDVLNDTECTISQEAINSSATHLIPKGNVVIATRVGLGKVCIIENDTAINQDLKGIIPKNSKSVTPLFLFHWLKLISPKIIENGTGATVQGVKLEFIINLKLPIPPLPEQQRIVAILDEAFAAIAKAKKNAEKNLANAQQVFETSLQSVFANRSNGWEAKKLGEVYDVRDGTHDSPKFQSEGFPLITSKNLKRDELNYDNVQYISEKDFIQINQRSKVHKGDILFAMIGTIGNPVVIDIDPDFAIKNVALFKIPKHQSSYFLKYYLDSKHVIEKMTMEAKGTTQRFVGLGYLRDFPILLPSLSTQLSIVQKLDALSFDIKKLKAIYQQKLTDLDELKKSILEKAFAGELNTN
ncbi:MAG: restriction endonuclease subunit S [bacterium]